MLDLHCHIIPNIDDGSKDFYMTLNMIKQEMELGYKGVFATSHFIPESLEYDMESYVLGIEKLNKFLQQENIDFTIYPANEIYYSPDILELIESKKVMTLNNTKYFLVEFPMNGTVFGIDNFITKSREKGYIPIIAHPERYSFTSTNFDLIKKLKENGAYFQANVASILGYYGKYPKKNVIKLFDENLIDFIGTDSHDNKRIYSKFNKAISKLKNIISNRKFNKILYDNPNKILKNVELE